MTHTPPYNREITNAIFGMILGLALFIVGAISLIGSASSPIPEIVIDPTAPFAIPSRPKSSPLVLFTIMPGILLILMSIIYGIGLLSKNHRPSIWFRRIAVLCLIMTVALAGAGLIFSIRQESSLKAHIETAFTEWSDARYDERAIADATTITPSGSLWDNNSSVIRTESGTITQIQRIRLADGSTMVILTDIDAAELPLAR